MQGFQRAHQDAGATSLLLAAPRCHLGHSALRSSSARDHGPSAATLAVRLQSQHAQWNSARACWHTLEASSIERRPAANRCSDHSVVTSAPSHPQPSASAATAAPLLHEDSDSHNEASASACAHLLLRV